MAKTSATVAVGPKSLATAVELRPSVQHWWFEWPPRNLNLEPSVMLFQNMNDSTVCVQNILFFRIPDSLYSDAVSGWVGLVLAHPEFWNQLTLFQPRRAYHAYHIAHQNLKT